MANDDDVYEHFQCEGALWRAANMRVLFSDSGNILLGVSRLFAFSLLFFLNWYNRRLLRSKTRENTNVVPGLVLPSYFNYIYLYISFSLLTGVLDIMLQVYQNNNRSVNNWLLPFEQGVFHWIYEGLAFFLMRYGAGVRAFRHALFYSAIWGAVSFVVFFVIFAILTDSFGIHEHDQSTAADTAFALYATYNACLLLFYGSFLVVPVQRLYRRGALESYAKFNVVLYTFSLLLGSLLYVDVTRNKGMVCSGSVISFLLVAITQPLVMFYTLQLDSQYWQGIRPDRGNPLAAVWDHIDLATAQSMAENAELSLSAHGQNNTITQTLARNLSRTASNNSANGNNANNRLPVLHFALIDFDENEHYVAGGFSRVYFGRLRGERVAFKVLFAMELTPDDVRDFYAEASLLYSLAHENVCACRGVCVMPPALTMVLEHCVYGSLYDFLYKPVERSSTSQRTHNHRTRRTHNTHNTVESERESETVENPLTQTETHAPLDISRVHAANTQPSPSTQREHTTLASLIRPHKRRQRNSTSSLTHSHTTDIELGTRHTYTTHNAQVDSQADTLTRRTESQNTHPHADTPPPERATFSLIETGRRWINAHTHTNTQQTERDSESESGSERDSESEWSERGSESHRSSLSRVYKTYETLTQLVLGRPTMSVAEKRTSYNSQGPQLALVRTAAHNVTWETRVRMMRDAARAIAFLHSKGYMHCDIKSLNFLVDENYTVKIADLGEVRPIHSEKKYAKPPIPARNWAPPEVIMPQAKAEDYTTKSEVYGMCLVLVELITLELPFGDLPDRLNPQQWFEKLVTEGVRPSLPAWLDADMSEIVRRGLHSDPLQRPDANEVLAVLQKVVSATEE